MSEATLTPAVVIELELEATPRIRIRAANEAEEIRVLDWINAHDEIAGIVLRALDLSEEEQAA